MRSKLVGSLVLFLMVFLLCWPAYYAVQGESQKEWTVEAIREELGKEYKWIMWGVDRTLFVSKLDGSDRRVVFDGVGEEGNQIDGFSISYDGSIAAVLMHRASAKDSSYLNIRSLWLLDLGRMEQHPIMLNVTDPMFNLKVSTDGSYVVWTISSTDRRAYFYDVTKDRQQVLGARYFYSAGPAISYDSSKIIFLAYYQRTWLLFDYDIATGSEQQISKYEDGSFWNPSFYKQSHKILSPLKPSGKDYQSLWLFDPVSRDFSFIAEVKNEDPKLTNKQMYLDIFWAEASKKNDVLLFGTGHNFYSIIDSKIIKINETIDDFGSSVRSTVDADGKYVIYSTANTPRILSRTDALFYLELSELLNISDHISATWYNHPPFPPMVKPSALENANHLAWEASERGSYPILGYRVYRRSSSSREYELIHTTSPDVLEYADTEVDLSKNCYYLVRAFDEDDTESLSSNEVFFDRIPPEISLISPENGSWHASETVVIRGRAFDMDSGMDAAFIDDEEVELDAEGFFDHAYTFKQQGSNEFALLAVDRAGNRTMRHYELFIDTLPPVIDVDFPQQGIELFILDTYTRGKVFDQGSGIASLEINYQNVELKEDGSFVFPIAVNEGDNTLIFKATDKVGNSSERTIYYKGVARILVKLTIGSRTISVNDTVATIDAPPFIDEASGRTMVPARFVVEPIGGVIIFDANEQKVTITRRENIIELWIGRNTAKVNGKDVPIDSNPSLTPMIVLSRTFLPLRFVAENIGFKVTWDPINYMITLEFPDPDMVESI